MNLDLTNRNAFVGGSSKGIGWATAVELALLGANVTLSSRNEKTLQDRLRELPTNGTQTHGYLVLDYSNFEETTYKIAEFAKKTDIHILINNTGGPSGGAILEEAPEKFEAVFKQHLSTNQFLAQAFFEGMKRAHFGRIVNIISISVKQPIMGLGVSNTVRWAVASWAKTLSKEVGAYGITVNNVLPGYTKTSRLEEVNELRAKMNQISVQEVESQLTASVPIGRFALPEEVAAAVAFLCTPVAASINGVNIPVDGGMAATL